MILAVVMVLLALSSAVTASERATVDPKLATDVVSVYTARQLDDAIADRAIAAAQAAGGAGVELNGGVLGLLAVRRAGTAVQQAPAGYRWPLSTAVMPPEGAGRVVSRDVARILSFGQVVMTQTTASLHGVQQGDVLTVLGWDGAPHDLVLGMVAPDSVVDGPELMISPGTAGVVALARPSSVVLWGFRSRAEIDQQLAAAGLVATSIRIRRSWDPPDPDGLLSYSQIKVKFGEFAYNDTVQEPGWVAANLSRVTLPLGIRAMCHNVVIPALQGALNEVASSGLAAAIDVGNTNTYGGCYGGLGDISPLGSTTGGFLSKHSWGVAIDMNTVQNPEGAPPTMNCDVVRIFRKWGFAWGGNFIQGDGMHFEYVGERRDQWAYPSRYCPNIVTTAASGASATPDSGSGLTFSLGDGH
jgi:D-alanyl-D-alanine carboxypeptidase